MKKWFGRGFVTAIVLALAIQAVPYGRRHENPPVRQEPNWNSPVTRALAQRACFDCHSNETVWPWYSNIAPSSWLVQHDVDEGRENLNFSEWDRPQKEVSKVPEAIRSGDMPPWTFRLAHPEARLNSAERETLIRGLQATFASQTSPLSRLP